MANLATALFTHGKITTTLTKAKALRPFAEKIITLAKHANVASDQAVKLHFRRLAISNVRDIKAVSKLFDQDVTEFLNRNGGYTRIYKLLPRRGDDAKMAIIEQIKADDPGYKKQSTRRRRHNRQSKKKGKSSKLKAESDPIQPEIVAEEVIVESDAAAVVPTVQADS
jgi:large subunit ribosomal protein L17